jgi:hypothetical protein
MALPVAVRAPATVSPGGVNLDHCRFCTVSFVKEFNVLDDGAFDIEKMLE